jgi:glutaredoxin|tara:strand:+ start:3073 stop:3351 length:279 start_codon:yes stop_codon:yes gene_type:complete
MDKLIILYSQQGCPYCIELKESLDNENIDYVVRDIDKYRLEWDKVNKITDNEYVPTALVLNMKEKKRKFLAPDRDWDEIPECVDKIKKLIKS